jgi:uncharacterized protein YdhG (YjbR/CyaY superfamily)
MEGKSAPTTIDEYISSCAEDVRPILTRLRAVIHAAAPEATEKISYAMPAFFQKGILVYFAAGKNHIGFYPTASGIEAFKEEIEQTGYKWSKGAVQFPLDKPLPEDFITRVVKYRAAETAKKK